MQILLVMARPPFQTLPNTQPQFPRSQKPIFLLYWKATKIAEDVADGKIVYVGDYFTLQAGGSSEGKNTADEVNASSIKSVKTIFRPGKMIKDALKLAEFKKKE